MKVPQYEQQVGPNRVQAAQPGLHAPVRGAFGEQLAQAGENMSRSMQHAAYAANTIADREQHAFERQQLRDKNLRKTAAILAWRKDNDELLNGKLNEDGSRVDGGLLTKQYGDAANITETYNTQGRELMAKHLAGATTPEEKEEWTLAFTQDFQNNIDRVAQHQYKQQTAQDDLLTNAYGSQQEGLAGSIRSVAEMRTNLDDTYKVYNENASAKNLPEPVKQLQRYGIANKNISASVKGAILNDDIASARAVLDGVKNDLLPDDYNQLNAFVKKAEATYQKASEAEVMGPLYERALKVAEGNPEALQKEIIDIFRNPAAVLADVQQNYGPVKAKQLIEYAKWVQTNLLDSEDTRSGQLKADNWQAHQDGFKAFEWKDKTGKPSRIENKNMNNPRSIYSAIGALRGHIEKHDFNEKDMKEAQKHLIKLRTALGNIDIKEDGTAFGVVVRQANILSGGTKMRVETGEVTKVPVMIDGVMTQLTRDEKNYETYYVGGILTDEEKGIIIERTIQGLSAKGINLQAEDAETANLVAKATQEVARDYVRNKFAVVRDDVTDVQVGNNTFKSYGIKPNPNLGATITSNLDGYRQEEHNGVAYLVKRDKKGNELHRQLLWTNNDKI